MPDIDDDKRGFAIRRALSKEHVREWTDRLGIAALRSPMKPCALRIEIYKLFGTIAKNGINRCRL